MCAWTWTIINHYLLILLLGDGDRALPEPVPEAPADVGEVPHPAGAGGLPPAGLDGPAELPRPGAGVAAVGARLLLDVERDLAAAAAQRVRLVAPLTERARTLRLEGDKTMFRYITWTQDLKNIFKRQRQLLELKN